MRAVGQLEGRDDEPAEMQENRDARESKKAKCAALHMSWVWRRSYSENESRALLFQNRSNQADPESPAAKEFCETVRRSLALLLVRRQASPQLFTSEWPRFGKQPARGVYLAPYIPKQNTADASLLQIIDNTFFVRPFPIGKHLEI